MTIHGGGNWALCQLHPLAAWTSGVEPDRPACTFAAQWLLGVEEHARRGWPCHRRAVGRPGAAMGWRGGRVASPERL